MSRFLPLVVLTAALAGCTTAPGGAAPSLSLAGTHWTVTAIDGQPAAAPDRARLGFEDARLSANVGCNGMGGGYRIEGGRIVAGPLMATRMFCEGPVWQQEQAVNALLAGAPEVEQHGDVLRLRSGGHSLEARRLP
ncbi:META domain-containing protein [Novosphingobium sp. KCTC 2891]|uniref:META domain-containing protein n=1 Tax=Novosphingobium sp. KCTC 2891 TaxID=2989730 RepID=UPI0022221DAD|nr:META domain-containing protein [Novosphingobium sp. KCTC 2891]MCW1382459.1 META domain-containing protein [Novosphingobium sp. KCTC 2891]